MRGCGVFLRQSLSPSVVPRHYTLVIPEPQSRDGRLWAPAKAAAASTKLCAIFCSQGLSELQPVLLQSGLRLVLMSCIIADLSLSRRPASVKIAMCSLQAKPKSYQLPQSDHVIHNLLPDYAGGPQACWLDRGEMTWNFTKQPPLIHVEL